MTDPQNRAEILSGGPGAPADRRATGRWDREDDHVDDAGIALDLDTAHHDDEDAPQHRFTAWRALLSALFGPESLAVSGFVLAVLPSMSFTVLGTLATTLSRPDELSPDGSGPGRTEGYLTMITGLSAGLALLGVVAGFFALRRAGSLTPGQRGLAGAAVLVGLLVAVAHITIKVAGGAGDFYF